MRTLTLISLVTLLALPLAASAQIYSWKDASGKTIYSDKPPLEKKVKTREVAVGSKAGSEAAAAAKPGEGTTPAKSPDGTSDGATPGKNPEQQKAESDARQNLCDNARKRLIQLESSPGIIVTKNEKGEMVPLVDDARKTETDSARKDVEQWCK